MFWPSSYSDPVVEAERKESQVNITEKDSCPVYQVEWKNKELTVSPEEVISMILLKLKGKGKSHGKLNNVTSSNIVVACDQHIFLFVRLEVLFQWQPMISIQLLKL